MTTPDETHVRIYRAGDARPGALAAESVAVLGYGHLGRSAAFNLRDSGVKIRIGNRHDEYADQGRADAFDVVPLSEAASDDIVCVFLPDEVIPDVFAREIVPALRPGSAVVFASGYSLSFDLVHPPDRRRDPGGAPHGRDLRGARSLSAGKRFLGPAWAWRPIAAAEPESGCWHWPRRSAPCAPARSR